MRNASSSHWQFNSVSESKNSSADLNQEAVLHEIRIKDNKRSEILDAYLEDQVKRHRKSREKKMSPIARSITDTYTSEISKKGQGERVQKLDTNHLIMVLKSGKDRRNQRKIKMEDGVIEKELSQECGIETRSNILSNHFSPCNNNEAPILSAVKPKDNKPLRVNKIIQSIRESNRQVQRISEEKQWKEIEDLISGSVSESKKVKSHFEGRRNQLEAAKMLLTGKVSIIWIFVIKNDLTAEDKNRIVRMYNGMSDRNYRVPLCSDHSELDPYLTIPSSLFKIVTDLSNAPGCLKHMGNSKIIEYFIYNSKGCKGNTLALHLKSKTRKVRGIYQCLEKIINRAEQETESQIEMFESKNGLALRKNVKKFPAFLKLSGEDKTQATLYRANLYGGRNMQQDEKSAYFDCFMALVSSKYGSESRQTKNISDYKALRHCQEKMELSDAKEVIKFYVRESFYYHILNSMLRTLRTVKEFKPCMFPFHETYHAVKMIYMEELTRNSRSIEAQTLYRGTKLKPRDFNKLKPNTYIEMFGFMSTSKSLDRAKEFTDGDGYILVLHVPKMMVPKDYDKYDHGFIDINKYELAEADFAREEQVLFNALNIYKVLKVEIFDQFKMIHLEYGPISGLLAKKPESLSVDEKDVLTNYQFCTSMLQKIEDQGDVLQVANEFEDSKQYYQSKINSSQAKAKYYLKLANVQQKSGELEQAEENCKISLEHELKVLDRNDRELCLKIFSIHSKNAQISFDREDYLDADNALTAAIELLPEEDVFEKAKKIRERGEIKFKKAEVRDAEKDLEQSQSLFKSLTNKAKQERKNIEKQYGFSLWNLLCSSSNQELLEAEKAEKLKQLESLEEEIEKMGQIINDELIRVNNSLKEVAHFTQDKEKYEICVKKARGYLLEVKARQTNDPRQKARLKVVEATIQDYLELAQSQKLLEDAIELIESGEPFDPLVGKYSSILADLQKKECEKYTNPKIFAEMQLKKEVEQSPYDEEKQKETFQRCRANYEKAINILLYNKKSNSSPEIMALKNQVGELDFSNCCYDTCEKIIKEVRSFGAQQAHSEVAKSCLLLSKIDHARGELKSAFVNVEEAETTLRKALVKKEEEKYIKIYECCETFGDIQIHRTRIYMRRLDHDMALKQLSLTKAIIHNRLKDSISRAGLAEIYELEAESYFALGNSEFEDCFEKAIKLREKQMGALNLANAVTYCNYAKHMVLAKELDEAQKLLSKAFEIFSCIPQEHPISWLFLYCNAIYHERRNHQQQALQSLQKSISRAKQKYDKGHITINKIRFQYAKILLQNGKIDEGIKELEELDEDLEIGLRDSHMRNAIESEKDDEKVSMKKSLYDSLLSSYKEMSANQSLLLRSTEGQVRVNQKLIELRAKYKMEDFSPK